MAFSKDPKQLDPKKKAKRVAAIVSAYESADYLVGRLQNLVDDSLYVAGELEIVVIDSNSPQDEGRIVADFQRRYQHIHYLRTPQRETVYAAWNRGIDLTTAPYVINANTDDRFLPGGIAALAALLDSDSTADVAYGDWLYTGHANDHIASTTEKVLFLYPDYDPLLFLYYQITGHAALIRRSAFDRIGKFDAGYSVYGDRDWMLRFANQGGLAQKVPTVVGLYHANESGLENANPSATRELGRLRQHYTQAAVLPTLCRPNQSTATAHDLAEIYAEAGARGHSFFEFRGQAYSDLNLAAHLLSIALKCDPANPKALEGLAFVLEERGQHDDALLLRRAAKARQASALS